MATYDLYGCKLPIDVARELLESAIEIQFEARYSLYQGGEYFSTDQNSGEGFVLKKNIDPFDGEPAELRFANYPVLFYVNASDRSSVLTDAITRKSEFFALLRHEEF